MSRLDVNPAMLCRIHIVGGPGSGKSTLARQLGACLGMPVYHLDKVAFEGPDFIQRPRQVRLAQVHDIAVEPRWIVEGMFLGWTNELLRGADAIVWLDQLGWQTAAYRIVIRFARWGVAEAKRQPGARKFNRFGDYTRNLRQLVDVLRSSHAYYAGHVASMSNGEPAASRMMTAQCLEPFRDKVIHCRNSFEVQELVAELAARRRID